MEELYTLQREVGRGSYGVVFEGHMSKTGQKVAIKRLPCSSPECMELYLQELWAMRATAKSHAHVIALHGCLLQTGARSLKPLRPGRLPLRLVEAVLKGSVGAAHVEAVHGGAVHGEAVHGEDNKEVRTNIQRRTGSVSRLQDRTNTVQDPSDPTTPQRPSNRSRKRPSQTQAGRRPSRGRAGPLRCLALWLVMEFCDGGDLNRFLLSRPPDVQRNLGVVRQLCSAVAFLHGRGITHRDLKPDNVLVCVTPKGPVVKVADFGLSKVSEGVAGGGPTRQHFSSTCGSDFYMAPEVWGGQPYSAPADIFSLGVMFWAVLERITFLEEGSSTEQLGAYVGRGRWLLPLGEALWENPGLQLVIPVRFKRTPPVPPPPGPALCSLLVHMLASDPETRPPAQQLETRLLSAVREDSQ